MTLLNLEEEKMEEKKRGENISLDFTIFFFFFRFAHGEHIIIIKTHNKIQWQLVFTAATADGVER